MSKYRNHGFIMRDKELRRLYMSHISAMTEEGLHSKGDIAEELAVRDAKIDELLYALNALREWALDYHTVPTEIVADVEYALAKAYGEPNE